MPRVPSLARLVHRAVSFMRSPPKQQERTSKRLDSVLEIATSLRGVLVSSKTTHSLGMKNLREGN